MTSCASNQETPDSVTLSAPIVDAIQLKYEAGVLFKYSARRAATNIGIEDLHIISDYKFGKPLDARHAATAIKIELAEDVWVSALSGVFLMTLY